jgi:hypothetical protein
MFRLGSALIVTVMRECDPISELETWACLLTSRSVTYAYIKRGK